jgi:hypothetical protein
MDMATAYHFTGASGVIQTFYESIAPWKPVPAIYMFAGRYSLLGGWFVAYVGQTGDASDRFPDHERWSEAQRKYGATHILTHISSPSQSVRESEERDLILALNPPMNVHHRPQNALRSLLG